MLCEQKTFMLLPSDASVDSRAENLSLSKNNVPPEKTESSEEDRRRKQSEYHRAWRLKNKERLDEYHKEWESKNKDKVMAYRRKGAPKQRIRSKRWKEKHPGREKEYHARPEVKLRQSELAKERRKNPEWLKARKEYLAKTREHHLQKMKERRNRPGNLEDRRKKSLQNYYENRERISQRIKAHRKERNEYARKYFKERRANDPVYRLQSSLRSRLTRFIKGKQKCAPSLKLIGCTREHLRAHLEAQFKPGMSWENYGYKGWHCDHILPITSFDLTDPEQQRKCFGWQNLQPLWWHENLSKKDKLPHQAAA